MKGLADVRRYDSARLKRLLAFLLFAAAALLPTSTCRSTKHTVARIITPAAVPTEVFEPAPAAPAAPAPAATFTPRPAAMRPTAAAAAVPTAPAMPSPTPTSASMPVVTAPPGERSPGVLYEQYVPTVVATTPAVTPVTAGVTTPIVTPIATRAVSPRSTRPPRTPTPAATQKSGVYYGTRKAGR
jgi:hypothetical protein